MDNEFQNIISKASNWENIEASGDEKLANFNVSFSKEETGIIKIASEKTKTEISYKLKPLNELYNESIKEEGHEHIETLLFVIESEIQNFDTNEEELSDSRIISVLEKLSMKPELEKGDLLLVKINLRIRLQLSMHDFSRANVRQALRKITKSAKLHNSEGGKRGYIDFINKFFH